MCSSRVAWLRISRPESCRSGPTPTSHAHRSPTSRSQELPRCSLQVRGPRRRSLEAQQRDGPWMPWRALVGLRHKREQASKVIAAARRPSMPIERGPTSASQTARLRRRFHMVHGPRKTRPLGEPTAASHTRPWDYAAGSLWDAAPCGICRQQLALCSSGASRVEALRTAQI